MRIGVDLDDVVTPWYEHAHAVCEAAGITSGVVPSTWHPYKEYGCTQEEWLEALAGPTYAGLEHELYGGAPYPDAIDALSRIRGAGHTIHIVTARGTGAWPHGDELRKTTIDWLRTYAVPHDSLTFAHDKAVVHTDMFVDDNAKTYDNLVAAGVEAYLMTRSWNNGPEDWKGDSGYRLRVESMTEFAAKVLTHE